MNWITLRNLLLRYWLVAVIILAAIGYGLYSVFQSGLNAEELLAEYGYYVILVWTFLEGETIVIIAGLLAPTIGLKVWLIAICAFVGAMLSDQLMFTLGKYKGEKVLQIFPSVGRKIDKAAGLFKKYDTLLILSFRFVYGVRNVTPIMLGISGVSHKKFFFLNFIGATVWAFSFAYGGYYIGRTFLAVMGHVGHGIFYVIVGVLAAGFLVWFVRSRLAVRRAVRFAQQQKELAENSGCAANPEHGPKPGEPEPARRSEQPPRV